jgi:YHS domain-containing protein
MGPNVDSGQRSENRERRADAVWHNNGQIVTLLWVRKEQKMLEQFSDPVCGVEVNAMNARGQREYRGTIYYFCSEEHQSLFQQNPEKYVQRESATNPVIPTPPA